MGDAERISMSKDPYLRPTRTTPQWLSDWRVRQGEEMGYCTLEFREEFFMRGQRMNRSVRDEGSMY